MAVMANLLTEINAIRQFHPPVASQIDKSIWLTLCPHCAKPKYVQI